MSLLSNLAMDDSIEQEKDTLGGGYSPLDTDIYKTNVSLAYLEKSKGGALGLVVHLTTDQGRDIRQTIYMTSGDAKGNKNYYVNKDGEKNYLPGFLLANSLAELTTGKQIAELEPEDKVVPLYSSEAKAEVPTKVQMLMDLVGKDVYTAVFKQIEDKNKKGDDGKYYPTGETIERNEIEKFFCALDGYDKMTSPEIRAKAEAPAFFDTWKQKWAGQVRDKSKGKAATNGQASAPVMGGTAQAAASKPTTSLFAQ
jgi:hypothetical protein